MMEKLKRNSNYVKFQGDIKLTALACLFFSTFHHVEEFIVVLLLVILTEKNNKTSVSQPKSDYFLLELTE